jgi:hypothetical protein
MNTPEKKWQRLVSVARQVPDAHDASAPYGFTTRVVAQARMGDTRQASGSVLERMAFRALGVACLLAVLGAVVHYVQPQPSILAEDILFMTDDPVAILLELS